MKKNDKRSSDYLSSSAHTEGSESSAHADGSSSSTKSKTKSNDETISNENSDMASLTVNTEDINMISDS